MIHFLSGEVVEVTESMVVLDVGGVGYRVFVPAGVAGSIRKGDPGATLHTSLIVSDDNMSLYGFLAPEERDIFNLLIQVSGIGPKAAVRLLSLPKNTLVEGIAAEDVAVLTTIPGIGPKTAKRVILELRDKVTALYGEAAVVHGLPKEAADEAELAAQGLRALGYSGAEIRAMIRALPRKDLEVLSAQEIIRLCLKKRK